MRKLIFASISTVALLTLAACDNNQGSQSGGADTGTTSATPAPSTGNTGTGTTTTTPPSTGGTSAPAQ
ncbi:hypothetical protein [Chelativorans sp. J32]|jgi:Predicted solute binding protein|uniref:hypothetical protein n=1 Tax=Chelativorans sp. J32 TaxID=935840 RepID=UPI000485F872|nr:hypothetical protein [Chelativorans sp. J32]